MAETMLTFTRHELSALVDLIALAEATTGLTRTERALQRRFERLRRELERHRWDSAVRIHKKAETLGVRRP